jgi:UDP-N-acetylmuramoylalanine--D-glutamate ligase
MKIKDQKVLILGAARQGIALARFLVQQGAEVILNDHASQGALGAAQEALDGMPIRWVFDGHPLELLEDVSVIFVSGGVPLDLPILKEARNRDIPLSNDSQIFMEQVTGKVIGVTGSAGKTTTTALVGQMAKAGLARGTNVAYSHNAGSPPRVWVGGNIGNPLIAVLDQMHAHDLAVMELSSFQLDLMTKVPQVAAVLNLSPNHLDRHLSMEAYVAAKARILDFQTESDVAVLSREDRGVWSLKERVQGRLYSFGRDEPLGDQVGTFVRHQNIWLRDEKGEMALIPMRLINLRGEHNLQNVLAACALAAAAGLPRAGIRAGVESFTGLPHRLEYIRRWGGADWYNDSIATAPERAIAAIRSFEQPIVLLAGGRDKDLPWEDLALLIRQRVDHLVLFGEAAGKMMQALAAIIPNGRPFTLTRCDNLFQAVLAASELVEPGDVVLMSPGGTSFDEFQDFEQRGEYFKQWVKALS